MILSALLVMSSCEKFLPKAKEEDQLLDGPVAGLTAEQYRMFLAGDVAFNDEVFTPETGLGPIFVSTSCGSCHAGDGKGHPFTTLTRFGQFDSTGNVFLHMGGPQLQNRANAGFNAEQVPSGATFSKFTPPANTGLGFLEALTDDQILSHSDPYDQDGDGISGRPNYVDAPGYFIPKPWNKAQNGRFIGRFGKKAAAVNLLHQTANAYNQDMGITSVFQPKDVYSLQDIDPEVSTQTVNDVVFYLQTIKAPIQRIQTNPEVITGKQVFVNIGCENCHKQTLKTGFSTIEALSNKEFHPYTDLLLHDMGSTLDDGYTEGNAKTYEWKTPPLWGLGLSPKSQGGSYFLMHDGRATSIEDAIILHGGEAAKSKTNFQNLSQADKNALLKFLQSL
ncbi:MAG: di-heme oxidoredictase family protein [Bacteroidota bacterium]